MLLTMLLMPGIARLSRHHLKALGVKADVISIILGSWTQPPPQGTHIKFERLLTAHNGCRLRQVLTCSASSSDRNWARVVSRDFLKREREKEAFLSDNDGNGGETFDTTTDNNT